MLLAAESAARKHVASAELVRHALRLLYRLIQFEDSKALSETLNPEASDASLLDMALRCMERHCDNAPIQDHGSNPFAVIHCAGSVSMPDIGFTAGRLAGHRSIADCHGSSEPQQGCPQQSESARPGSLDLADAGALGARQCPSHGLTPFKCRVRF